MLLEVLHKYFLNYFLIIFQIWKSKSPGKIYILNAANKYYSSDGHYEQKKKQKLLVKLNFQRSQ